MGIDDLHKPSWLGRWQIHRINKKHAKEQAKKAEKQKESK
jgi:hypothetical protein